MIVTPGKLAVASALSASLIVGAGGAALATAPSKGKSKRVYTAEQVATHNSASNCWTIVNGKVYKLTRYISKHPGGAARITALCGIDGTAAFTAQHGSAGAAARKLSKYKIGTLAGAATATPAPSSSRSASTPGQRHDDDDDHSPRPTASGSASHDDDRDGDDRD